MPAGVSARGQHAPTGRIAGRRRADHPDTPPFAILDLELEGKALRQAVIDIMMINASVHTAVVSDMDPDEFHEATEGLGILMPLPTSPKADDAERLLKALAGVM
ncbi:MAG: hypothetical protein ACLT2T_16740 [Bilophila wadsworthia]